MAKKKRAKHQPGHVPGIRVVRVPAEVVEAERLTEQKRLLEARDLLLSALPRYPTNTPLLEDLLNAAYDVKDLRTYELAAERLLKLTPDEPDLAFALAGVYSMNFRPALARRAFQHAVARWPDHPKAAEALETIAGLEKALLDNTIHRGTSTEDDLEVATLNEESMVLMERGDETGARRAAEALLRRHPDFVPALNNLSQILYLGGKLDRAIATTRHALEVDPGNFHALANLVRFQLLAGRPDEARSAADQLEAIRSGRHDLWVKIAEALSFLGDDEGVLSTYARASQATHLDMPTMDSLLLHLVAVAEWRQGREDEARKHWRRVLELDPGFDVARQNLADLDKPVGERHAPWPFPVSNWLPAQWLRELSAATKRAAERRDDNATRQAMRRYLRDRPEVANLVPLLLDRGDPYGRGFAVRLAKMAGTEEMAAALRDFALSQRGPDDLRLEAAQAATEHGLLPSGTVRLWQQGEWRDVILLGFEIGEEARTRHSRPVQALVDQALEALGAGDAGPAVPLLQRALEVEPEAPDLLNNLAAAYEMQGRRDESLEIVRQIHERNPDYLFAITTLAQLAAERGQYDEAKALLQPLLSRRKLHSSAFVALCNAYVTLYAAEGNKDAVRSWLALWRRVAPDSSVLQSWERRLGRSSGILQQLGWQGPRRATGGEA